MPRGWGLLQADLVEPFLLQFYALSAHAYTRGTFVAPESALLDRSKVSAYKFLLLFRIGLSRDPDDKRDDSLGTGKCSVRDTSGSNNSADAQVAVALRAPSLSCPLDCKSNATELAR